jgi:hypothetical protein
MSEDISTLLSVFSAGAQVLHVNYINEIPRSIGKAMNTIAS